jgi:hypothetical protein
MNATAAQDVGPDFSKFRNISPAFAGTIIDWSMGSREITATVIDLILRDYLFVIDTKVIRNKKSKPLKNFENKFINTIFGQSVSLSFEEFSKIAFKKEFDNLLKIIADGMMEEGYIDKNFQEKMVKAVKNSIDEMPLRFAKESELPNYKPQHYENVKVHVIPTWAWIVMAVIFLLLHPFALFVPFVGYILSYLWMIVIFVVIPILLFAWAVNRRVKKKLGKSYDWMLTQYGKNVKDLSLSLKKYMDTYPLIEDRLANELVDFAIAFGLGKIWISKMGKLNANVKIFVESLDSEVYTVYRFMDWDSYLNAFEEIKK